MSNDAMYFNIRHVSGNKLYFKEFYTIFIFMSPDFVCIMHLLDNWWKWPLNEFISTVFFSIYEVMKVFDPSNCIFQNIAQEKTENVPVLLSFYVSIQDCEETFRLKHEWYLWCHLYTMSSTKRTRSRASQWYVWHY